MKEVLAKAIASLDRRSLIVMPISRILIEEVTTVGEFSLLPPGALELDELRPVPNITLESLTLQGEVTTVTGQAHREIATSLTGFSTEILESNPLVIFPEEIPWERFLNSSHNDDVELLRRLSATAERAFDWIRFHYCSLDLPNTLPGAVGSWPGSGEYLGALIYTSGDHESYQIAGAAANAIAIVSGIGLDLYSSELEPPPTPQAGEMAALASHALALLSDAMYARNQTSRFLRAMTLLEFLACPYEYKGWKDMKGDVACHSAKDKHEYLAICARFRQLTGLINEAGMEVGLRTQIIHYGRFLEYLMPAHAEREILFRELQMYAGRMIDDMLKYPGTSWEEYKERRASLKRQFT